MEFSIKSNSPEKQRSGCVIIGVFESRKLTEAAERLDKTTGTCCPKRWPAATWKAGREQLCS